MRQSFLFYGLIKTGWEEGYVTQADGIKHVAAAFLEDEELRSMVGCFYLYYSSAVGSLRRSLALGLVSFVS